MLDFDQELKVSILKHVKETLSLLSSNLWYVLNPKMLKINNSVRINTISKDNLKIVKSNSNKIIER